jgi:integral membrane protein
VTHAALTRYRVMAYATGVMLLVLVGVAMPVKYLGHNDTLVAVVGPLHGWLYFLYLLSALWLAYSWRWDLGRTVLVALAGTVPFASFVAERVVVRDVGARLGARSEV